jgi:hypothetical protein
MTINSHDSSLSSKHMADKSSVFKTVSVIAGSLLAVTLGILANFLTEKLTVGVVSAILAAFAIVAVAGLIIWRRETASNYTEIAEAAALKRLQSVISLRHGRFANWNLEIDVRLSVASKREGQDFSAEAPTTRSAFIASLNSLPHCTIVTGTGGSGKSALLAEIALHMIDARTSGVSPYTPIVLEGKAWNEQASWSTWVINQTKYHYGIEGNITHRWLNQGSVILIIDGLDEISDAGRQSFVPQLNNWLRSAVGGRAVVASRIDSYRQHFKDIIHDQVANLEPLPYAEIESYLRRILDRNPVDASMRIDSRALLDHVIRQDPEHFSQWYTPLLIRLIADGVLDISFSSPVDESPERAKDPAALAVGLGDRLRHQGNDSAAIELYMVGTNSPASQWRSIAGVRASLLLARSGEFDRARETLISTLATEIEQSYHEPLSEVEKELTSDEQAVLDVLSLEKTLDAFQVSSLSSVPPNRCNEALRSLRAHNIIEIVDPEKKEPRFRRLSPDFVGR